MQRVVTSFTQRASLKNYIMFMVPQTKAVSPTSPVFVSFRETKSES